MCCLVEDYLFVSSSKDCIVIYYSLSTAFDVTNKFWNIVCVFIGLHIFLYFFFISLVTHWLFSSMLPNLHIFFLQFFLVNF